MPNVETKVFGELEYQTESLFRFPSGLPGFEDHRSFVFLKKPGLEPLMFLQSVESRSLCFILLPIRALDDNFRLELTQDEIREIGLTSAQPPVIGKDILCAAMICTGDGDVPTANLMAPIVVNLHNNVGIQAIHPETGYSHRHPLLTGAQQPC